MSSFVSKGFTAIALTLALAACDKTSSDAPSQPAANASATSAPVAGAAKADSQHVSFGGFAVDVPAALEQKTRNDDMAVFASNHGAVILTSGEVEADASNAAAVMKQTKDKLMGRYPDLKVLEASELKVGDIALQKLEATMSDADKGEAYTYLAVGVVDARFVAITIMGAKAEQDAWSATGDVIAKSLTKP